MCSPSSQPVTSEFTVKATRSWDMTVRTVPWSSYELLSRMRQELLTCSCSIWSTLHPSNLSCILSIINMLSLSTIWAQLMISTLAILSIISYSQGQNNLSVPTDTVLSPATAVNWLGRHICNGQIGESLYLALQLCFVWEIILQLEKSVHGSLWGFAKPLRSIPGLHGLQSNICMRQPSL